METQSISSFMRNLEDTTSRYKDVVSTISESGDLLEITSVDVLVQSIMVALLTEEGTYPGNPSFGFGIQDYIFEPCNMNTKILLEQGINKIITMYEPRAEARVIVSFYKNRTGFVVDLNIKLDDQERKVRIPVNESALRDFKG